MAHDLLQITVIRKVFSLFSASVALAAAAAFAQNVMIPDSIELPNEQPAAYVQTVPQGQGSFSASYASAFMPVSSGTETYGPIPAQNSVLAPSQDVPAAQYAAQAPAAQYAAPMQSPVQDAVSAPVQYAAGPEMTADGQMPVVVEDGGMPGMMEPAAGLFLPDFCESYCVPCGGGMFGPGQFFVEGYAAQGFNVNSNASSYGEPMAVNDKEGYQLNQLYLSFGRRVFKCGQWALGGQLDVMYGTDYYYMTSTGLETSDTNDPHWNGTGHGKAEYRAGRNMYGMALPQAFLEVYAPLLAGVDVKVGHFHSVMGFESNQANQNFFYSRSYTSVYGMPTSMTGVMSEWKVTEGLAIVAGAVNEWNAFDTPNDHFQFVVGATYENMCGNFALSALVMNGKQSAASFQADNYGTAEDDADNTTVLDLIAKFKFTERLIYAVEFTYGNNDTEVYDILNDTTFQGRNWYGFSNYLFYRMSDTLTLGARFEWFNDKENSVLSGGYKTTFVNAPANYFSWTFGANWDPCPWLTVRPEIRWDYCDLEFESNGQTYYTYDRNTANYQFTVGCDAIIRF